MISWMNAVFSHTLFFGSLPNCSHATIIQLKLKYNIHTKMKEDVF